MLIYVSNPDTDFAPTITSGPPAITTIGAGANFSCTVSAKPTAHVFWTEGDSRHRMDILTPENLDQKDWVTTYEVLEDGIVQAQLHIPRTTEVDFLSIIYCVAVNKMGQAKQIFKLEMPLPSSSSVHRKYWPQWSL